MFIPMHAERLKAIDRVYKVEYIKKTVAKLSLYVFNVSSI